MNGFCPNCEEITSQTFIQKEEDINIRGEQIPVLMEYYHCEECGEDFEKPRPDYDPLEVAYMVYRERKGMMQPQALIDFRKSIGLTQKEFSILLGIGIATLNRYENGSLQSDAHDQMIRLCVEPSTLLKILSEKVEHFSAERYTQLSQKINLLNSNSEDLIADTIERFASYEANIFSGNERFNIEKLFQAIKYFCFDDRVYKTKLMKMLFYADFLHYKNHAVSITGSHYAHAHHGPVPDKYNTWLTAITEWRNELYMEEQSVGENSGEVYFTDDHDWSLFLPAELATLATVKDIFQKYTATQIREFSHEEAGYKQTCNGELISYEFAKALRI